MTHNTKKLEEIVETLLEELSYGGRKNYLDDTMGMDTAREILRTTLHHQLQKARHDWLREEIVRLGGMKKKGQNGEGLPFENSPEIYGNARMEAWKNGSNKALQTIIDHYQAELNQDNK